MTQYVYGKNVVKQLLQDGKPIQGIAACIDDYKPGSWKSCWKAFRRENSRCW